MPEPTGPLAGVTVVEFGNLIAAPYCGMLLADLGATVVKLEPPTGDLGRTFGPYVEGESAFFMSVNRGKASVTIDFRSDEGLATAREICQDADAVIHNLLPGVMERWGLGYEDLRTTNPGLVYGVASSFGVTGPDAERAGIDVVFQAESGMMSITGEPGDPPGKTATTIGDYTAATNLALGVVAALWERNRTGHGRRVDVALRDSLMAVQGGWNALAFAVDGQPERTGTASPFLAPNQRFATADGHLALAIVSDRQFARLCGELGLKELAEAHPKSDDRLAARDEIVAILSPLFAEATTEAWIERLAPLGLPVGRVRTLPEVWDDPQVAHNEMVVTLDHPVAGPVRVIGSPIRFDGSPSFARTPPPVLGDDSDNYRRQS